MADFNSASPGIGNYIHYRVKNYRKYGTHRIADDGNGGSSLDAAQQIYAEQKQRMLALTQRGYGTNIIACAELEKFLTNLLYGESADEKGVSDEVFNALQQKVDEKFNEMYQYLDIDWDTLTPNIKPLSLDTTVDNLQAYVNRFSNRLKTLQDKQKKGSKVDLTEVQNLANLIDQMKSASAEAIQSSQLNLSLNQDLVKNINVAMKAMGVPATAIGDVFEIFLACAQEVGKDYADKTMDELADNFEKSVQNNIKGKERAYGGVDSLNMSSYIKFVEGKNNEKIAFAHKIIHNKGQKGAIKDIEYKISTNPTQGKVDIIFNWKDKKLALSAKNYNFASYGDIHVVSGTPFFRLIQDENYDFVNHWLNVAASGHTATNIYRDEANDAMKMTIFAKAITGQTFGRNDSADVFVVNMQNKRQVRVIPMGGLMTKIAQTKNGLNDLVNIGDSYNKHWPIEYSNKWAGSKYWSYKDATVRITDILARTNGTKLTVSISKKIFQ